jgi:hypothetical protein
MIVADHRILMPAGRIAHAAEAATPSCDQRRQHRLHVIAEREVGIPDDAGSHAGFAGIIGFTSLRQVGDCLDLPDGAQLGRSIGAILETAVDEDRRHHVMAASRVGKHLVEHVPPAVPPDVMMGVDNWEVRLNDRLDRCAREPVCARRENAAVGSRLRVRVHSSAPLAHRFARTRALPHSGSMPGPSSLCLPRLDLGLPSTLLLRANDVIADSVHAPHRHS